MNWLCLYCTLWFRLTFTLWGTQSEQSVHWALYFQEDSWGIIYPFEVYNLMSFPFLTVWGVVSDGSTWCGLNVRQKQERLRKIFVYNLLTSSVKSTAASSVLKSLGSAQGTPEKQAPQMVREKAMLPTLIFQRHWMSMRPQMPSWEMILPQDDMHRSMCTPRLTLGRETVHRCTYWTECVQCSGWLG